MSFDGICNNRVRRSDERKTHRVGRRAIRAGGAPPVGDELAPVDAERKGRGQFDVVAARLGRPLEVRLAEVGAPRQRFGRAGRRVDGQLKVGADAVLEVQLPGVGQAAGSAAVEDQRQPKRRAPPGRQYQVAARNVTLAEKNNQTLTLTYQRAFPLTRWFPTFFGGPDPKRLPPRLFF